MSNNSLIAPEQNPQIVQTTERTLEREAEVVKVLDALKTIKSMKEWSTLKTEVFDSPKANLEKDLVEEAKKKDPDPKRLNRIAGQLEWGSKFDLDKLEQTYRVELKGIRLRLHGQSE